jgi:hypothetical protein
MILATNPARPILISVNNFMVSPDNDQRPKIGKGTNILLMVGGGLCAIGASLRMLLRHEIVFFNPNGGLHFGRWVAAPAVVLYSGWLFLMGLVGLIRERRRKPFK